MAQYSQSVIHLNYSPPIQVCRTKFVSNVTCSDQSNRSEINYYTSMCTRFSCLLYCASTDGQQSAANSRVLLVLCNGLSLSHGKYSCTFLL